MFWSFTPAALTPKKSTLCSDRPCNLIGRSLEWRARVSDLGEGQGQMGGGYTYKDKNFGVIEYPVDQYYLKTLDMHLIAGRNFDLSVANDTAGAVIINETLAKTVLGTTADKAIGSANHRSWQ